MTLALRHQTMKMIIRKNGHLVLEGGEKAEELRTALIYLRGHESAECKRLSFGIPIEALMPDITVLAPVKKAPRARRVQTADISTEEML
jgi:hypothetical protein